MDAAEELTSARLRAGFSRRLLAERAGVAHTTVGRIERGELEPTVAVLDRLLNVLGHGLEVVEGVGRPGRTARGVGTTRASLVRHRDEIAEIVSAAGCGDPRVYVDPGDEDLVALLVDSPPGFRLPHVVTLMKDISFVIGHAIDVLEDRPDDPSLDELRRLVVPLQTLGDRMPTDPG